MVNIREKDSQQKGIYTNYQKMKGRPLLYLAFFFVVIIVMAVVYNPNRRNRRMSGNAKQQTTQAPAEPQFVKQGELTFLKPDSTKIVTIDIEIADDDALRGKGLMDRRQMELGQGMLFIFEEEDYRAFWMKNTYLPLDILYLDGQKRIVRIWENTTPLSEESIPSDAPAKYVVEVNAGFCALYGITTGDQMTFIRK
jgi:uncharacterized membrane protein (UPF0127 family)